MKTVDVMILNVIREYEEFKAFETKKTKDELYEDAEKIYFYKNIHEFFQNFEFDEKSLIVSVFTDIFFGEDNEVSEVDIILFLWDCYLKYENLSVSTFSHIEELIDLATF